MTRRNGPGELEAQVMRRLRATAGPLTGRQVWESFTGPNPPARTTVLTVLARLEDKGQVRRLDGAEPVRFEAAAPESEAVAAQMEALLAHASDRRAVLTQFAGLLGPADVAVLTDGPDSAS
ncbi:MAG: BlaI/MecI/CopY family transcriptional regulator [Actinobacteria bacterium]|nr:BlaI/MecI/CopY family transcriptional regulator [Actinomycetota bacterium]